jgi:hypothetical protein
MIEIEAVGAIAILFEKRSEKPYSAASWAAPRSSAGGREADPFPFPFTPYPAYGPPTGSLADEPTAAGDGGGAMAAAAGSGDEPSD